MSKEPEIYCPNCGQLAIKEGNEITCEHCDVVFTITRKEGAKVKQLGSIEDHEKRISLLESRNPPEPEPVEHDEPEETSILG